MKPVTPSSAVWRIAALLVCSSCYLVAQGNSNTPAPRSQSSNKSPVHRSAAPKLTAQQQLGLKLLKNAEAEAAGLGPVMQTYVLWQVSHGYRRAMPKKADAVLQSAFTASRGIQDNSSTGCPMERASHMQRWLQREILNDILHADEKKSAPERVEKLLPQATPELKMQMLDSLAREYVRNHNIDRARELMQQLDPDWYSFGLAGEVMTAIPESRSEQRLAVFEQALQNFENQKAEDQDPNQDDFASLLIRVWRQLPADSVLNAVDTILERSKERDDQKKENRLAMILMGGSSLQFGSEYEFRLFQLLPIVKELDSSRAERLLKERNDARTALSQYPDGMKSIDPNYYGEEQPDETAIPAVMDIVPVANDQMSQMLLATEPVEAQVERVLEETKSDPEKAYQDALNLPLRYGDHGCPRATGLRMAALALTRQNPSLAKSAMKQVLDLAQDVDPVTKVLMLADVPDFYLKLGDEDGARSAVKAQMELAEKLYDMDTDSSDPNRAFEGAWPSTNEWRIGVQQATKISPSFAEELLAEIPDPDIAGFERVAYANSLLGVGESTFAIFECHKNGKVHGVYGKR